ncbi:MAG: 16S rRNA (guanine(527)-N(7))-methyltransferase RsmG, partial [Coriobacteriia bacterium]|nr:16S rRNA (guanine(527)-N(7))-methyltransferase RsmG [Coriobacteriia bacterium]
MQWEQNEIDLAKQLIFERFSDDEESFDLALRHLELVMQYSQEINLTSIKDFNQAIFFHIYDSLLGLPYMLKENSYTDGSIEARFVDIGSGAGYPGIPLAIYSGLNGMLVESIQKKAVYLCQFVDELGLSDKLQVEAVRAEKLAISRPGAFDFVCARAVASLASLMELTSPLLKPNGILIAYKGPASIEEAQNAKGIEKLLGMSIELLEESVLPV